MSLFITCPVENVERTTAFYTCLGWTLNTEMSDHNVSCFAIAPEQYVMLGSREMYASVGGVEELIGGPETPSKVTVSFDLNSREAVDELVERARAAGGRIGSKKLRKILVPGCRRTYSRPAYVSSRQPASFTVCLSRTTPAPTR